MRNNSELDVGSNDHVEILTRLGKALVVTAEPSPQIALPAGRPDRNRVTESALEACRLESGMVRHCDLVVKELVFESAGHDGVRLQSRSHGGDPALAYHVVVVTEGHGQGIRVVYTDVPGVAKARLVRGEHGSDAGMGEHVLRHDFWCRVRRTIVDDQDLPWLAPLLRDERFELPRNGFCAVVDRQDDGELEGPVLVGFGISQRRLREPRVRV